ncbi:energy-coupling factor transporter ATPase [Oscillospiraceae bacterium MB08-C2-2]|nr:energy-coupling factor transporter ATPase [Oscillospiraceae bacterium MB08-C2-2]
MAIIKTENLTYIYSAGTPFERAAIQDINLEIQKGDFVGLIGHTGSGKSTLIQHFNGLLAPASGKIYIDGEDIWAKPKEIRRFRFKVGLVFQYPEYQLFEETVYKDIAFGPLNMGLSSQEVDDRIRRAAHFVELSPELFEKSPFELSGGQKRRVALAGVLAMEPDILVLDEPTAGLDPKGRDTILTEIQRYHEQRGTTVVLVSHSMEDIARFAKKVLVMRDAQISYFEDVSQVFTHAAQLEEMGLTVPQVTRIFGELHRRGFAVEPNTYTIEQAKAQLLALMQSKGEVK